MIQVSISPMRSPRHRVCAAPKPRQAPKLAHPSLRVVREQTDGVVISGMKMLATAAVYADDMWIGNLQPLDASRLAESVTCAIPIATKGLSLWARQPYALNVHDPLDYPVSYRFDESDCVLVCEEVLVP